MQHPLIFNPVTGEQFAEPNQYAENWRTETWLYNPWTGVRRGEFFVGFDPHGRGLTPASGRELCPKPSDVFVSTEDAIRQEAGLPTTKELKASGGKLNLCLTPDDVFRFTETAACQEAGQLTFKGFELTGGKLSGDHYYRVKVAEPIAQDVAPYTAECADIIEALGMTFNEGEAFKALWRLAAARQGRGKPGNQPQYDADKAAHYGARVAAQTKRGAQ